MANTLHEDGKMEINSIAADWDYGVSKPPDWPAKPAIHCIVFIPGATNDKLVIKERDTGMVVSTMLAANDAEPRIQYFHGTRCIPYIDQAASTLNAGHKVLIQLWRK